MQPLIEQQQMGEPELPGAVTSSSPGQPDESLDSSII
jgi:hypothetical protein